MSGSTPLISVVIPCYQQAHFLGEAIFSVLTQTYSHHEIIVVDDGSTDDPAAVAGRYPNVRYIRQENQGTAAARNRGLGESCGSFLVFLDADDRLLPEAFETALTCLNAHPECAFAFGLCALIAADGSPLSIAQEPYLEDDHYLAMLRQCPIWHPATVMCRRAIFDRVVGFDTSLIVSSDYDFYLRVARSSTICCHNTVVAEYRQHNANKSLNNARMLKYISFILQSQAAYVKGNKRYEQARCSGIRYYQELYYKQSAKQLLTYVKRGENNKDAFRNLQLLLRYSPQVLSRLAARKLYQFIITLRRKSPFAQRR